MSLSSSPSSSPPSSPPSGGATRALPASAAEELEGLEELPARGGRITMADVTRDGAQLWLWAFPPGDVLALEEFCKERIALPAEPAAEGEVVARVEVGGAAFEVVEGGRDAVKDVLNAFPGEGGGALEAGKPFVRAFAVVRAVDVRFATKTDDTMDVLVPKPVENLGLCFRPAGFGLGGGRAAKRERRDEPEESAEAPASPKRARKEKEKKKEKKHKKEKKKKKK